MDEQCERLTYDANKWEFPRDRLKLGETRLGPEISFAAVSTANIGRLLVPSRCLLLVEREIRLKYDIIWLTSARCVQFTIGIVTMLAFSC